MNSNPPPDQLFLLKAGFMDGQQGPFYCPDCAQLTGLLEYHPELRRNLDIQLVDFPRPRPVLVELLGAEYQSCPVLVLGGAPPETGSNLASQSAKGRWFIEGATDISRYLATVHGTAWPHD